MHGKEWEREASITIFEKGNMIANQNMGIRIKGDSTRNNPGKSFNLYAKEKYGKKKVDAELLENNYDLNGNLIKKYKTFALRCVYEPNRLKDKFVRDLFSTTENLAISDSKMSILFLNGEYWGMYLIQEKIDDNYISSNYLLSSNKIIVAKAGDIEDGPEEELDNFEYFCGNYSKKDVANKDVYSEIKNYIDIDSLVELFANGLYISNLDWPGNNDGEWKYLGKPIEGNKYTDGKWRFFLYDIDYSMGADFFTPGSPESNDFEIISGTGGGFGMNWRRMSSPVNIFLNLIKNNTDFQKSFANLMCDYANWVYNSKRVNEFIEKYREECTDLITYSLLRWSSKNYYSTFEGYAFYKNDYYKSLDSLKYFFEQRPKYILQYMKNFINLEGELVELIIEIKGRGKIQINSITPIFNNNVWKGKYFTKIPIKIKAISENGYNFKGCDGIIQSNEQSEESILLSESEKIIAIFD